MARDVLRTQPMNRNLKTLSKEDLFSGYFVHLHVSSYEFIEIFHKCSNIQFFVRRLKRFSLITEHFRRNATHVDQLRPEPSQRSNTRARTVCTVRDARQTRGFTVPRFSKLSRHLSRARW